MLNAVPHHPKQLRKTTRPPEKTKKLKKEKKYAKTPPPPKMETEKSVSPKYMQ